MLKRFLICGLLVGLLMTTHINIMAGGISADAGLTPAQDKWILRTQIRYMQSNGDFLPMPKESETCFSPARCEAEKKGCARSGAASIACSRGG